MNKPLKQTPTPLSDQNNALELYLNALLSEIDEPNGDEADVEQTKTILVEQESVSVAQKPMQEIGQTAEKQIERTSAIPDNSQHNSSELTCEEFEVIPRWANSGFQVLSFDLGENLCSAPVNMISSIIPTPSVLTYLPLQKPWLMGLYRYKGNTINVFDLEMIINQDNSRIDINSGTLIPKGFIVLIGEGRWGFVIKKLDKMTSLYSEDITWKSNRNRSDAVIGTISKSMSTLLDIDMLLSFLSNGQNMKE